MLPGVRKERERDTGGCREREREREREKERKKRRVSLSVSVCACVQRCGHRAHEHTPQFFFPSPSLAFSARSLKKRETCLAGGLLLDAAVGRFVSAMLGWPAERSEKMMLSI